MSAPRNYVDIDGVLNSLADYNEWRNLVKPEDVLDVNARDALINLEAMARLNTIVEAVPIVEVWISSTWRHSHTLPDLRELFKRRGARFVIAEKTPPEYYGRWEAIYQTLYKYEQPFVVLDDDWPLSKHDVEAIDERLHHGLTPQHNIVFDRQIVARGISDDAHKIAMRIQPRMVHTDPNTGLTAADVIKAISILTRWDPQEEAA